MLFTLHLLVKLSDTLMPFYLHFIFSLFFFFSRYALNGDEDSFCPTGMMMVMESLWFATMLYIYFTRTIWLYTKPFYNNNGFVCQYCRTSRTCVHMPAAFQRIFLQSYLLEHDEKSTVSTFAHSIILFTFFYIQFFKLIETQYIYRNTRIYRCTLYSGVICCLSGLPFSQEFHFVGDD